MSDVSPCRTAVLVASVSGDPIVLAKLLQGVRPQRLLVFSTPEARRRGWEKNARAVVEVYGTRTRSGTADFLSLEGDQAESQGSSLAHQVFQGLCTCCGAAGGEGSVAFDCTTGQGILRILGYEAARRAAAACQRPFHVVYCDGDRNEIVFAAPAGDGWRLEAKPVRFDCTEPAEDLQARFALYGVKAQAKRCLFHAGRPLATPSKNDHSQVFSALCQSPELRWFFNSYYQLFKQWQLQKWRQTALPPDYLSRALAEQIRRLGETLSFPRRTGESAPTNAVEKIVERCVQEYLEGDCSPTQWLKRYRADPQLQGLRRRLQTQAAQEVLALSEELQRQIPDEMRMLHRQIVKSLRHWAAASGEDIPLGQGSPDEHRKFHQAYLADRGFQGATPWLANQDAKVGEIFEDCLARGVLQAIVNSSLADLVGGVYQGVELMENDRPVAEFDTLVLFRTGDLLVFEAKTHYENADRKKIQANTKQFRDCGGAYGRYLLVFPLVQEELDGLIAEDPSLMGRWQEAGIEDVSRWARAVRSLLSARDAKMIGLDRLAMEIQGVAQRWIRPAAENTKVPIPVVVHPCVDLDACACVALAGVDPQEVAFLPADATTLPTGLAKARVLDHDLGLKGPREPDGTAHAAALSMPEAADLLGSDLLAEIDEQDRSGKVDRPRFSLASILGGLRLEFRAAGLGGEGLDRAILGVMVPVLRGLVRLERQRRQCPGQHDSVPVVEIGPWRFAVRDTARPPSSSQAAGTADCVGMVYHDGFNLGVNRYPGQTEPDLHRLAPYLPGWFIHSAGFLACWGSRKAPATAPPPTGTPQTVEELVALMRKVLL